MGRYDMILHRDISKALGLNIELYEHVIKSDDGTLKGPSSHVADLGMYELKKPITGKLHSDNRI